MQNLNVFNVKPPYIRSFHPNRGCCNQKI